MAPAATLIGDVTVEAGASVWFNVVLRVDFAPIVIGPGATIGHACVVHGAHIGARGPVAGTGAERWVKTRSQIYRYLALRYRTGLKEI